jgi:CHRD domain
MGFVPSRSGRVTLGRVKKLVPFLVVLAALVTAAAALSAATATHRVAAHLTTRVEIPKPRHASKKAFGAFTGTLVVEKHDLKLTWKLAFVHLTGTATGVTLSQGKPGLIGKQITVLCKLKECRSGMKQTTLLRKAAVKPLLAHLGYVTVYTRTNPAGEIRGQIRVKQ